MDIIRLCLWYLSATALKSGYHTCTLCYKQASSWFDLKCVESDVEPNTTTTTLVNHRCHTGNDYIVVQLKWTIIKQININITCVYKALVFSNNGLNLKYMYIISNASVFIYIYSTVFATCHFSTICVDTFSSILRIFRPVKRLRIHATREKVTRRENCTVLYVIIWLLALHFNTLCSHCYFLPFHVHVYFKGMKVTRIISVVIFRLVWSLH